jgi:hypothetical protein
MSRVDSRIRALYYIHLFGDKISVSTASTFAKSKDREAWNAMINAIVAAQDYSNRQIIQTMVKGLIDERN